MKMTKSEETSPIELLVADDVRRDAQDKQRVIGEFRVGGHPVRAVLDFGRRDLGLIEYVELPALLASHVPSERAAVRLMSKVYDGEAFEFPLDLSEEVRRESPPSPFEPMSEEARAALEAEAKRVRLELLEVERDAEAPARLAAKLRLEGEPLELEVELHAGPRRVPLMRWLKGPAPESLSAAERYAILRALVNWQEGSE